MDFSKTINKCSLNTSKSKAMYSFSKSPRFNQEKPYTYSSIFTADNLFMIPEVLWKREPLPWALERRLRSLEGN